MDQRRAGRQLLQLPEVSPARRRTVPAAASFAISGMNKFMPLGVPVLLLCSAAAALTTLPPPALAQTAGDSAAAAAVVERYHDALATGDSTAALAQLAEDAVILESGGLESRAEYRSHHLPADIAFVRAVRTNRSPLRVTLRGDVAWTTATSTTRGKYRGKPVNSRGAELMVLTRGRDGWKISAIHWSSRDE
jgi:ketosteroid isomerase-like protein